MYASITDAVHDYMYSRNQWTEQEMATVNWTAHDSALKAYTHNVESIHRNWSMTDYQRMLRRIASMRDTAHVRYAIPCHTRIEITSYDTHHRAAHYGATNFGSPSTSSMQNETLTQYSGPYLGRRSPSGSKGPKTESAQSSILSKQHMKDSFRDLTADAKTKWSNNTL